MIDLHCHLDLHRDPPAVIRRIEEHEMYVLAVTTTPRAWAGNRALTARCKRIRVGLGLHPEVVLERHEEVELLCALIPEARYVGEIGLDRTPKSRRSFSLQQKVLGRILKACAQHGGRILSLHSRGASSEVLDALEAEPRAGVPILHWFSGSMQELDRAAASGCWFSVGPAMLRSRTGRELIKAMPRSRVLTESDGPFAIVEGRPAMPWDVAIAERGLAEVWGMPDLEATLRLRQNLNNLVRAVE